MSNFPRFKTRQPERFHIRDIDGHNFSPYFPSSKLNQPSHALTSSARVPLKSLGSWKSAYRCFSISSEL